MDNVEHGGTATALLLECTNHADERAMYLFSVHLFDDVLEILSGIWSDGGAHWKGHRDKQHNAGL